MAYKHFGEERWSKNKKKNRVKWEYSPFDAD